MYLSMADDYDIGCWIFLAQGGFEEGEEGLTFLLISSRIGLDLGMGEEDEDKKKDKDGR